MNKELLQDQEQQKEIHFHQIRQYVEAHVQPFDIRYRMCIDGRYGGKDASGIAIPGGDTGLVLALAEMYTPREAFEYVTSYLEAKDMPFCSHTDEHEGHHNCITGCGHINAAIIHNAHYGIDEQDAMAVLQLVCAYNSDEKNNTYHVTLHGEHEERAIIINHGVDMTISPSADGEQYFVYDQAMHEKLIDDICDYHGAQGTTIDRERFHRIASAQATTTLGLLGSSRGKPIAEVTFDNAQLREVAISGYAPEM